MWVRLVFRAPVNELYAARGTATEKERREQVAVEASSVIIVWNKWPGCSLHRCSCDIYFSKHVPSSPQQLICTLCYVQSSHLRVLPRTVAYIHSHLAV